MTDLPYNSPGRLAMERLDEELKKLPHSDQQTTDVIDVYEDLERLDACLSLLKELQGSGDSNGYACCPACRAVNPSLPDFHLPSCPLWALIKP